VFELMIGVVNMEAQTMLICVAGLAAGAGLYAGKLARRVGLPSLIGYMLFGVFIGVSGLKILDGKGLESMTFITKVALGFVAFAIGSELNLGWLRRQGFGVVSIILAESFGAFVVVFAGVYLLTRDLPMALMFAAVAPASAPAGTVSVIQEYKAKGPLTKILYAVVGFDDALAIIIYAVAAAVAKSLLAEKAGMAGGSGLGMALVVSEEVGASLLIGVVCGLVFNALAPRLKKPPEILVLTFAIVCLSVGFSEMCHASLILSNMIIGLILANTRKEETIRRVTSPLGGIMPLIFVLFFCLAGAHLDIAILPGIGLVGIVYILCRSAGLVGGSRLGATLCHMDSKIKNNVGLGILSQAGVAIGLALVAKEQFEALGTPDSLRIGAQLIVSITATSIIFEIIGPILTKVALTRAGEINQAAEE
jgi:Kef-type K+ transport system membrane component KefB